MTKITVETNLKYEYVNNIEQEVNIREKCHDADNVYFFQKLNSKNYKQITPCSEFFILQHILHQKVDYTDYTLKVSG